MPPQFRRLLQKIKTLFLRDSLDRDFDEELGSHLDLAIEDGRRRGLDAEEARRVALLRLGGVQQARERQRDVRGLPLVDGLRQDIVYGLRTLRRSPVFTLVVVASLALGIGANTAVFTLMNAVLFRPLPVPHPEALVTVEAAPVLSLPMYQELSARQQVFTGILAATREAYRVEVPGAAGAETIDNVPTTLVTMNYFDVLDLRPQAGRFFVAAEEGRPETAEAAGSVVVIGDGFWERHFARDPGALGKVIYINRSACRIVGIAPRGFGGEVVASVSQLWVPLLPFSPANYVHARAGQFTRSIARLKPGVSVEQAKAAMSPLFLELRKAEWDAHTSVRRGTTLEESSIGIEPVATGLDNGVRSRFGTALWIVMGIVAAVLLIACANVANLLAARSAWRRRELSLRVALGCGRRRLARQLLTESLLLAGMGMIVGLALAQTGTRALVAMADARQLDIQPDVRVLLFALAITLLTGLGFGVAPALRSSRVDLTEDLRDHGRSTAGRGLRQRLSRTLVVVQVALSLALLVGTGLLVRTLHNLGQVDLGFRPAQVLMFNVSHNPRVATPAAISQATRTIHERLQEVPGVISASLSTIPLFSDTDLYAPIRLQGQAPDQRPLDARFNSVSPDYFETVGMTLVAGRALDAQDSGDRLVAVVNETMAKKHFPEGALGRTMEIAVGSALGKPIEVVGVVRDAKYNNLRAAVKPMFFRSLQQYPGRVRAIEVRTDAPAAAAVAVRQALLEVAPDIMIREVISLEDQIARTFAAERLIGRLAAAFGLIALLLATVGLYGVLSYGVAQRTGEIGIRIALGATRRDISSMIAAQSLVVVAAGLAGGLALALTTTKFIAKYLYGLTPTDAATVAGAIVALMGAAAIAAYLPARRAARLDPVEALRRA
jgi:predicted permease